MDKIYRIITHSGNFHADEIFAVAALELYLDGKPYEVVRSRDPEVWKTGDFVVDVGMEYDPSRGRFDHHQEGGAGKRENGIPYSSFGLIWKHFGEAISGSKEVADAIDRKLGYPIDLGDNGIESYTPTEYGVHPYLLHDVVLAYRPTWKEGEIQDVRFMELVKMFRALIEREIIVERDRIEGAHLVEEAYRTAEDKRLIVLDGQYPWQEVLSGKPEPIYVVKPKHQATGWEVECVRDDVHRFANRKNLPVAWSAKSGEELAKITGVPDAVYCHAKLWVAVARSKEGALALAKLALAQ
jgi:uncharacterized UPF0160 family protein